MQQPIERHLRVVELGPTGVTRNGNTYLECRTDAGVVAFWGKAPDLKNIDLVRRTRLPAAFRCGCIPGRWDQHALWVPQNAE